jgi:hypothetical protein
VHEISPQILFGWSMCNAQSQPALSRHARRACHAVTIPYTPEFYYEEAKGDAIAKQIEGSLSASNQGQPDRATIRRVFGSATMQMLEFK